MANVIRLTEKENEYINEFKRLLEEKERIKAELWPLMGLKDYRSYIDTNDFHSIFAEIVWYAELKLNSDINDNLVTLEMLKNEKKES